MSPVSTLKLAVHDETASDSDAESLHFQHSDSDWLYYLIHWHAGLLHALSFVINITVIMYVSLLMNEMTCWQCLFCVGLPILVGHQVLRSVYRNTNLTLCVLICMLICMVICIAVHTCKTADLITCQAPKRIMSLAGSPVTAARLRCNSWCGNRLRCIRQHYWRLRQAIPGTASVIDLRYRFLKMHWLAEPGKMPGS